MEEAYTVGIRLALEDGVSSGIEAVSAQMATLDRAVAVGMAGLERFRALGAASLRPVAEPVRAARGVQEAAGEAAAADHGLDVERPIAGLGSRPLAAPVTAPRAEYVADMAAVGREALGAAGAPERVRPVVHIHAAPAAVAAAAGDAIRADDQAGQRDWRAAAPIVSAAGAETGAGASGRARSLFDGIERRGAAVPRQEDLAAGWAPAVPQVDREPLPASMAPALPTMSPMLAPQMESSAPPSAGGGESGPSRGDVYLDGTRMGRWIADRMAREAGRPQGGSTGFDARMGPAWNGTMQGV